MLPARGAVPASEDSVREAAASDSIFCMFHKLLDFVVAMRAVVAKYVQKVVCSVHTNRDFNFISNVSSSREGHEHSAGVVEKFLREPNSRKELVDCFASYDVRSAVLPLPA